MLDVSGARAGPLTATILPTGSSTTPVTVSLGGGGELEPARRLALELLREALTHADPVELTVSGDIELELLEVRRIGRSHHLRGPRFEKLIGLVVGVRLFEQDLPARSEEVPDAAVVHVLDPSAGVTMLRLSMQMAERHVADEMLAMIDAAHRSCAPLEFMVAAADDGGELVRPWIISVATTSLNTTERSVDAFVESVSTSMLHNWPLALVYMRTTASMVGAGRIIDDAEFHPQPLVGVVGHGSPLLGLLDRARSEGARVRVGLSVPRRELSDVERQQLASEAERERLASLGTPDGSSRDPAVIGLEPQLLVGVTVMAPLASAATPLWIRLEREQQDESCAVWVGEGCFNPGVYRIQIVAQAQPRVLVDGCPIARVVVGGESGERNCFFAHLCVSRSCIHELRVELSDWRSGDELQLDVFKLC